MQKYIESVIDISFKQYDNWCRNNYDGGYYIEWLNKEQFTERFEQDEDFRKEWILEKSYLRKLKIEKICKNLVKD